TNGEFLSGVRIAAEIHNAKDHLPERYDIFANTDNQGLAQFSYPPAQNLDQLVLNVTPADFVGRKMTWSPGAGEQIPSSYTFKLAAGIKIGGLVVDDKDAPISDARVSIYHWYGNNDQTQKGEQSNFSTRTVTTDAQGVWQAKNLPEDVFDRI